MDMISSMNGTPDRKERLLKQIKTLLSAILVVIVMAICKVTGDVSITIVLSLFLFILMLPIVNSLEKAKFPSWLATLIAVLIVVVLMLAVVMFLFYTVDVLVRKVPTYASKLNDLDVFLKGLLGKWFDIPEDVSVFSIMKIDWVGGVIMPALRSVSSSAVGIGRNVLVTLLMAVFLLLERHTLIPKITYAASKDKEGRVQAIWDRINRQVSKYIGIKTIVSVITGAFFYIVGKSVGLDFAFLWGVLAVVMNFIPTIGSIVITVLTIFMAVVQFLPNWTPILIVAAGTILTQNIIGNIIDPRLQGNQLNLSPFVILVALSVFGYVWGIVGMFLAVPLLSVLQIVFANMDETKPIAILMSSGNSFRTETGAKPSKFQKHSKPQDEKFEGDILFPEDIKK